MGATKEIITVGETYGPWRVLKYVGQDPVTHKRIYRCLCLICNVTISEIRASKLKAGTSSGCMSCSRTTHGLSRTHAYRIVTLIQERITNPEHPSYQRYGGRGITLYAPWHGPAGRLEMARWIIANLPGWQPGLQIERIDNNRGYEPGNLKWATAVEQGNNRRSNRPLTWNGKTKNIKEWAKELGVNRHTIAQRIDEMGWTDEEALSTPVRAHVRKQPAMKQAA